MYAQQQVRPSAPVRRFRLVRGVDAVLSERELYARLKSALWQAREEGGSLTVVCVDVHSGATAVQPPDMRATLAAEALREHLRAADAMGECGGGLALVMACDSGEAIRRMMCAQRTFLRLLPCRPGDGVSFRYGFAECDGTWPDGLKSLQALVAAAAENMGKNEDGIQGS